MEPGLATTTGPAVLRYAAPRRPVRVAAFFGLAWLALGACKGREPDAAPAPASASAEASSAPALPPVPAGLAACVEPQELLVPFRPYEHADLVRNLLVDGNQVVFRNYREIFRVPLSGGEPASLLRMPGGLLNAPMWLEGDRILGQLPGEATFLAMPKAGGPLTTLVDASKAKLRPGQSIPAKTLQGARKARSRPEATSALFDGTHFYWVELDGAHPKLKGSAIYRLALAGGAPEKLHAWTGKLESLARAGDQLVFVQREPVGTIEMPKGATLARAAEVVARAADTPASLMVMPAKGGKAAVRVAGLRGNVLLADGTTVYVSGHEGGDPARGGIFRLSVGDTAPPERVEPRALTRGSGHVAGDSVVLVGSGPWQAPRPDAIPIDVTLVLAGSRTGGPLKQVHCIGRESTIHAAAVAGKVLLLSVFRERDRQAAIAKLTLP